MLTITIAIPNDTPRSFDRLIGFRLHVIRDILLIEVEQIARRSLRVAGPKFVCDFVIFRFVKVVILFNGANDITQVLVLDQDRGLTVYREAPAYYLYRAHRLYAIVNGAK